MPHTVQAYGLDDFAADVYGNPSFQEMLDYLLYEAEKGTRSVCAVNHAVIYHYVLLVLLSVCYMSCEVCFACSYQLTHVLSSIQYCVAAMLVLNASLCSVLIASTSF
jgi:hypothetical protein